MHSPVALSQMLTDIPNFKECHKKVGTKDKICVTFWEIVVSPNFIRVFMCVSVCVSRFYGLYRVDVMKQMIHNHRQTDRETQKEGKREREKKEREKERERL